MKEIEKILDILEQVNATNVRVFDYEKKSPFFDYVIIATANDRQSNALVGYLKKANIVELKNVEGRNKTGWVLVDAGNIIVHIFNEEQRKHYNFDERLLGIKEI